MSFTKEIRLLQKGKGTRPMTQDDFALLMGMDQAKISRMENGRQDLMLGEAVQIKKKFNISDRDFLRMVLGRPEDIRCLTCLHLIPPSSGSVEFCSNNCFESSEAIRVERFENGI